MLRIATAAAVAFVATPALADWNEAIDGDLSNDPLAPTPVIVDLGNTIVSGSMAATSDTRDYFTFSIAPGQQLTGLFLLDYTDLNVGGNGNTGFIHIDDGNTSVVPGFDTISDFLGGSHLDRSVFPTSSDNMLTTLAGAPEGGIGFVAPLGPGDYTINIQQTGPQLTGYSVLLTVVPSPSAAGLFAVAGLAAARRRR